MFHIDEICLNLTLQIKQSLKKKKKKTNSNKRWYSWNRLFVHSWFDSKIICFFFNIFFL